MDLFDSRLWLSFKGRINRQPYFLVSAALGVGMKLLEAAAEGRDRLALLFIPVFLFALYVLMAIAVKRSHDLGKSGWFVLLLFIPILNLWPGLLFTFQKGVEGPNDYGEDPLAAPPAAPAA